jgi:hypothetical protein
MDPYLFLFGLIMVFQLINLNIIYKLLMMSVDSECGYALIRAYLIGRQVIVANVF